MSEYILKELNRNTNFDNYIGILICTKTHNRYSMHGKLEYLAGRKYKSAYSIVFNVINDITNATGYHSVATYNENSINYFREHFIPLSEYRKSIIEELL